MLKPNKAMMYNKIIMIDFMGEPRDINEVRSFNSHIDELLKQLSSNLVILIIKKKLFPC